MKSTTNTEEQDEKWMRYALDLAKKAAELGEVPVGAVVVKDGVAIGEGYNLRESKCCSTYHAEMLAIEEASKKSGAWRLTDCTLYVTLEPCIMCAGAITLARIPKVIYAAVDPKGGALGSLFRLNEDTRLNHRYLVENGLLAQESSALLKDFFRARRAKS